jgi:hypothetical protein
VRPVPRGRSHDFALGILVGGALVLAGVLALHSAGRVRAAADPATARGAADPRPKVPLAPPVVVPDAVPADGPLRRELERLATLQAASLHRDGSYSASAASLAYWPFAPATVSFDVDSVGGSWEASAFDPDARRQCAIRVGDAPSPYFHPLADGVVACRTLPDSAAHPLWGRSAPTTVWDDGVGRPDRGGSAVLRRLRAMQVAWIGDDEEDDGSDFVMLRDGQARVPYPDESGAHRATRDGALYLADATWGNFDVDRGWVAVIRLIENTGGAAMDGYLAVVRARGGRLVNGPPYFIGDRTRLLRLRAGRGVVTADLVVRGEHDPRCCPSDTVHARFGISGDSLVEMDQPFDWRLSAGGALRAGPADVPTRSQAR